MQVCACVCVCEWVYVGEMCVCVSQETACGPFSARCLLTFSHPQVGYGAGAAVEKALGLGPSQLLSLASHSHVYFLA